MMKSYMKSGICFPFGYINGQKMKMVKLVLMKSLLLRKVLNDVLQNLCSI